MHQALYRKWRPAVFEDVYGQDHITSVLKYEVAHNKVSHAYVFCGSRGTGKTTCAKILAKAVNCLDPQNGDPCGKCEACRAISQEGTVDILEMDAASNTGVDYIRDIRDAVVYPPAMLKTRVYIIDEVHMLSASAFNALLKTLEEPPERVIFILATTEVQKIPVTVLSRCQRFDFHRIPGDIITKRLKFIAEKEGISLEEDAAFLIARLANGGMRDAISLLEVASGQGHEVTAARVRECAGVSERENIIKTVKAVADKDWDTIFSVVAQLASSSMDIAVFWQELIVFYRDMMLVKATKSAINNYELTKEEIEQTKECASLFTLEQIMYHSRLLDRALAEMQQKTCDRRISAELTLVRMTETSLDTSPEALITRISELEEKLNLINSGNLQKSKTSRLNQKDKEVQSTSPEITKSRKTDLSSGETSASVATTESATKSKNTKSVADWSEILQRIKKEDPSSAAFLSGAHPKISGDDFIIEMQDSLSKMMVESQDNYKRLCETIIKINPSYASLRVVLTEASNKDKQKHSTIDDINF